MITNVLDNLTLPESRKVTERNHGELPYGDEGVELTISNMRRLARKDARRPVVRTIAERLQAKCSCRPGQSEAADYELIRSVYAYVIDNVSYQNDPKTKEFVTTPEYLLTESHAGDCDDMSTAVASICLALGYAVNFKVIAWKSETFTHVYNEVFVPSIKKWIPIDCVYQLPENRFKGFGSEKAPIIRKKIFRV